MFKAFAKTRVIDRGRGITGKVVPAHCNDNHIGRHAGAHARRAAPLVCRWSVSQATGRLECHWEPDSTGVIDEEEEQPWLRLSSSAHWCRKATLSGEHARPIAKAPPPAANCHRTVARIGDTRSRGIFLP
jgi:hypothetical protein